MKSRTTLKVLGLVMTMVFCYAGIGGAQSSSAIGAAALSGGTGAPVNLDFQIIIPGFIYFQVGSAAGTVDLVEFQPTADDVATGATTSRFSAGSVYVSLFSNAGTIEITETTTGGGSGLSDGTGNYINWGQIETTDTGTGGIAPPQLSNDGGNTLSIAATSGNITARTTEWTYVYQNPATPPLPGTYKGTATYTAAIP